MMPSQMPSVGWLNAFGLAVALATILVLAVGRPRFPWDVRFLGIVLLGVHVFVHASNTLEWAVNWMVLDPVEDYVQIMEPLIWCFLAYAVLQHRATESVRRSEQRFREVLEGARDAVYKYNLETDRCEFISPAAREVLGMASEDLLSEGQAGIFSRIHPDDRDRVLRVWPAGEASASHAGGARTIEYRWDKPDGTRVWLSNHFSLRVNDNGRSVVGTLRDVSELKEAAWNLEQTVEQLVHSNSELERFAHVASHDLQEPLRTITGYVELIERRYGHLLDAEGKEFVGYVSGGARRMHALIHDLLTYSRIGSDAEQAEPTDLNEVLCEVQENLKHSISRANASLQVGELPTVPADAVQMTQLFQNLLSNALKFQDGSVQPRVNVSAEPREDEWVFSVQDNGIGIDPDCHDLIFEAYKRLHAQDKFPGTGMGLAICRKIVERHGGRIWVESAPGRGTCFRFTLPSRPIAS